MTDEYRFDFSKAEELFNVTRECQNCADSVKNALEKEALNIGQWWKGASYNAFEALFHDTAGVRASLAALSRAAAEAGGRVNAIACSKRDFERELSKYFR